MDVCVMQHKKTNKDYKYDEDHVGKVIEKERKGGTKKKSRRVHGNNVSCDCCILSSRGLC